MLLIEIESVNTLFVGRSCLEKTNMYCTMFFNHEIYLAPSAPNTLLEGV